jgi:DNA-binding winged helix-turn-helix (wHTH) protein/Tfp pilus assembly protein PilF
MREADRPAAMRPYRFGSFVVDVPERRLLCDGQPVALTPKVFDTLVYLVERSGRLVLKHELLEAVWGEANVEEGSLPRAVHTLRKTLAAAEAGTRQDRQYIETVPTKGYRFVGDVTRLGEAPTAAEPVVAVASQPSHGAGTIVAPRALYALATLLVLALTAVVWRVHGGESRRLPDTSRLSSPTTSGAAYARFQSGRLHLERHLPGDDQTALHAFEAALQLDPAYAAAYAGKADALFFRYWETGRADDIVEARLAIRSAFELDGASSYAHTMRCRLEGTYDWDFARAETTCRRAVALDPSNHEAHRELAFLLSAVRRHDEALRAANAAIAIAPTSFNMRSRGVLLYFARRFDEAIAQLKQVEAGDPDFLETRRWLARAFEQKGLHAQAFDVLVRLRESAGAPPDQLASLRRAFASGNWPAVLRQTLPAGQPPSTLDTAGTFAQLGEFDTAFSVLESMISERRVMVIHMKSEPRLDPLRPDRRFQAVAARVLP